ncbi:MAG: DNA repair protein RecO C-terminal domain-containing protein, partial [Chlorobiales bacterium]|nr:DNA repair protein RecO C-terminal domain-containing protein [Chlorobiales bacterium]
VAWFMLRLISDMGFEPSIERCVTTGKPIMPMIRDGSVSELCLFYDPGGVALQAHSTTSGQSGQLLTVPVYLLMRTLTGIDIRSVENLDIPIEESRQLCDILQNYCSIHSDRKPSAKNRKIISQILSGPE